MNLFDLPDLRTLRGGHPVMIRPLMPQDAPLLQDFVRRLSPQSRRRRFQNAISELAPELLDLLLQLDHRSRAAFVALRVEHGGDRIIGEARYAPSEERPGASELALAVADEWQRHGLGTLLLDKLLRHAAASGIARIHGDVLQENTDMLRLLRSFGFAARRHPDGAWLVRMELSPRTRASRPA